MPERHFVKYTFCKLDPAWRRLEADQRLAHKREFLAACEDFGADHLLQTFSLVGTRGDADLLLVSEAENLDRIHEFHVVLAQSGVMTWAEVVRVFSRHRDRIEGRRGQPLSLGEALDDVLDVIERTVDYARSISAARTAEAARTKT